MVIHSGPLKIYLEKSAYKDFCGARSMCARFISVTRCVTVILIKLYKSSTAKRVNALISWAAASRTFGRQVNLRGTKIYFREIHIYNKYICIYAVYARGGVRGKEIIFASRARIYAPAGRRAVRRGAERELGYPLTEQDESFSDRVVSDCGIGFYVWRNAYTFIISSILFVGKSRSIHGTCHSRWQTFRF